MKNMRKKEENKMNKYLLGFLCVSTLVMGMNNTDDDILLPPAAMAPNPIRPQGEIKEADSPPLSPIKIRKVWTLEEYEEYYSQIKTDRKKIRVLTPNGIVTLTLPIQKKEDNA